ncbi:MAG TPA: DUF2167 domain-containing protein [bacterium]|nr:DUF2167 domain-containing protein [bacterium]
MAVYRLADFLVTLSFARTYRRALREETDAKSKNYAIVGKKTMPYPRGDAAVGMDYRYVRSHLEWTAGRYKIFGQTQRYLPVKFERGLTDQELDDLERKFDFRFPPDLRLFLSLGLPVDTRMSKPRGRLSGWLNWRRASEAEIRERLNHPYEGICFDVKNGIWLEAWGEKPPILEDRLGKIKQLMTEAPRLIPIYGHRYIPDRPHEEGNPIFSVWQTDIIHCGSDLEGYLENEFPYRFGISLETHTQTPSLKRPAKAIEFWADIVDANTPAARPDYQEEPSVSSSPGVPKTDAERQNVLQQLPWQRGGTFPLTESRATLIVDESRAVLTGAAATARFWMTTQGIGPFRQTAQGTRFRLPTDVVVLNRETGEFVTFRHVRGGYVRLDDWIGNTLDAGGILKRVNAATKANNKRRAAKGLGPYELIGWRDKPTLDLETHSVHWAISTRDADTGTILTDAVTVVLGRFEYEELRWFGKAGQDPAVFLAEMRHGFHFDPGAQYADFQPGDVTHPSGIAALVAVLAGAEVTERPDP